MRWAIYSNKFIKNFQNLTVNNTVKIYIFYKKTCLSIQIKTVAWFLVSSINIIQIMYKNINKINYLIVVGFLNTFLEVWTVSVLNRKCEVSLRISLFILSRTMYWSERVLTTAEKAPDLLYEFHELMLTILQCFLTSLGTPFWVIWNSKRVIWKSNL